MTLASAKAPLKPSAASHPSPNIALGMGEFKRISNIMKLDAGISMSSEKVNLVHARLQKRLRALSLTSFKDYCALVEDKAGHDSLSRCRALRCQNTRL